MERNGKKREEEASVKQNATDNVNEVPAGLPGTPIKENAEKESVKEGSGILARLDKKAVNATDNLTRKHFEELEGLLRARVFPNARASRCASH